jgi:malonyl-CoA O-methyltransferase
MFDKNAVKDGFSRVAANYDINAKLQETIRNKAMIFAKDYLPKKAAILDVGCGTAEFALEHKNWNIIGVDISYGMCVVARKKNTLVINADAMALPLKDECLDAVFSSLALQWLENPIIAIKEILRVLKPEGIAVITTFVHGTLRELEEAFSTVDSAKHISGFIEPSQLLLQVVHTNGLVLEVDERTHTEYYDNVKSLMRSIKNIGANNKLNSRRKGLMTPAQLAKLEKSYKMENGKIKASWNVLTMIIGKP